MSGLERPVMRWHDHLWRRARWLTIETEWQADDGWSQATWDVPSWAGPGAGIAATWRPLRRRLSLLGVPISPWRQYTRAAGEDTPC